MPIHVGSCSFIVSGLVGSTCGISSINVIHMYSLSLHNQILLQFLDLEIAPISIIIMGVY